MNRRAPARSRKQGDIHTLLCKLPRDSLADAAVAASDDGDLVPELQIQKLTSLRYPLRRGVAVGGATVGHDQFRDSFASLWSGKISRALALGRRCVVTSGPFLWPSRTGPRRGQ